MQQPIANRSYSAEEKRQLVANLDIEVAHRIRQFETWLADTLENFTIHQEGQISRIPKQVRSMTMREFGEKYQGNIQEALRGYQKERLVAAGADAQFGEIDKTMRKRKWVEGVEAEMEKKDGESSRATKTARIAPSPSPRKMAGSSTGPGTAQRARLVSATNKLPPTSGAHSLSRIPASPSPQKSRPPFNTFGSSRVKPPSRHGSPTKPTAPKPTAQPTQSRVPSSSTFNPTLPPKTPIYPGKNGGDPSGMRLPRKDESMLSLNGSPLANPYQFGVGWFKGVDQSQEEDISESDSHPKSGTTSTLKRSKSAIVVRRDPSVAFPLNGDSRTESQASFYTASSSTANSATHSRDHSTQGHSLYQKPRFPTTHPYHVPLEEQQTPKPRSLSARVTIPTKDGHLLELDPLQASPGSIDALEGITDSAKKQAKVEMGRLIQATVDKWKIG